MMPLAIRPSSCGLRARASSRDLQRLARAAVGGLCCALLAVTSATAQKADFPIMTDAPVAYPQECRAWSYVFNPPKRLDGGRQLARTADLDQQVPADRHSPGDRICQPTSAREETVR